MFDPLTPRLLLCCCQFLHFLSYFCRTCTSQLVINRTADLPGVAVVYCTRPIAVSTLLLVHYLPECYGFLSSILRTACQRRPRYRELQIDELLSTL